MDELVQMLSDGEHNAEVLHSKDASEVKEQVDRLMKAGLNVIASGANVPFADQEIFYGPIAEYADQNLSVIPDFISNCGMTRVYAYLMEERQLELTDQDIFQDCSQTIRTALQSCYEYNSSTVGITSTALELALKKLLN